MGNDNFTLLRYCSRSLQSLQSLQHQERREPKESWRIRLVLVAGSEEKSSVSQYRHRAERLQIQFLQHMCKMFCIHCSNSRTYTSNIWLNLDICLQTNFSPTLISSPPAHHTWRIMRLFCPIPFLPQSKSVVDGLAQEFEALGQQSLSLLRVQPL